MANKDLQLFKKDTEKGKDVQRQETIRKTREELNKIVAKKLHGEKVTTLSSSSTNNDTTYVRYTSAQVANLSAIEGNVPKQRIIKIKDEKVDPMLTPSFKIRKAPSGPPTDSIVPVLHDELNTEKITKADQKKWHIAPAVSNWKNTKGFIIGIENRLKNSGDVNELSEEDKERSIAKFSALSNALKSAEQKAKQDINARASWRKRKEAEEDHEAQERLNRLAEEARKARASSADRVEPTNERDNIHVSKHERRMERRRRAEEELKRDRLSTKQKVRKLAEEQGRDVSERVVLGVSEAIKKKQKESVYDADLYLKSNTRSNNGDEIAYDSPLFNQDAVLNDIYRSRNLSGYRGLGSKDQEDSGSTSVAFVKDSEKQK